VRETKKIGPLKIDRPYLGNNQSMFMSISRKKIDDHNNKHALNTPAFKNYRPNKDYVLNSKFSNYKIPTERKNTSMSFVKLSENLGSL
jgi:hypothetical protein